MSKDEILKALSAEQEQLTPVEMANLLDRLTEGGLAQDTLNFYFKQAFPSIPLRTIIESGAWSRVSDGGHERR
ncbi:hypothetical protein G6O69_09730 [Pseudenhygromyxa sp. WMMC2535]|uniref:hypothetical protein n=1 Tax=Pseudenhygromyxa sp. WMMC2535 TaxID=2712867 RepID=UPI0015540BF4|nr:hypothetical protein [Pseudenhygromyxa sp. WMMC2535]NVB38111.1 hypothetical protein [Pseudenhygromyxa sp. WMMC2535]